MISVSFVQPRKSLFFIYFDRVARRLVVGRALIMKWLAKNQIILKSNIFSLDKIIVLRLNTLSTQRNTFTSLLSDITYGPTKQGKYSQK